MPETSTRSFGSTPALARAHLDGLQDAEVAATGAPIRIDDSLEILNWKLYNCCHVFPLA